MLHLPRQFLTNLSLVFLFTIAGCELKKENVSEDYNNYKFDPQVIANLPLYDSLAVAISGNYAIFRKYITEEDAYRAYRYMPSSTETYVFKELPAEADPMIGQYFNRLGKNFIYAFDLFRDSTIKIYVKTGVLPDTKLDTWESLSYYPPGTSIRRREFPDKDTVLNKNWQYWVRFSKSGLF